MKTDDFIKNLSEALPGTQKPRFYRALFFGWAVITLGVLGLSYYLLPTRPDFAVRSHATFFHMETAFFFLTFLVTSYVAYRSSIPGLLTQRDLLIGLIFIMAAAGFVALRFSNTALPAEFLGEMDWYRGRCGPVLFIVGMIQAVFCFALARLTAPTRPVLAATWLGLSTGAIGLFVVQFICEKENFLHLAIWHLTPVVLLAGVSAIVGKKALRW